MKMKKVLALLMAACLMVGMCACSGGSGSVEEGKDAAASAASPAVEMIDTTANENLAVQQAGETVDTTVAGEPVDRQYAYGELVIGTTEFTGGFDRVNTRTQGTRTVLDHTWDALFIINPDTYEVEPQMVDTYEWSDDHLALTMTLKEGIKALDGEAITAEDVVWSMERNVLEGSVRSSYYQAYDFEKTWAELDPDSLTFTLYYKYEYGPGLSYLVDPVYPKDWGTEGAGADNATWWDKPNSTGPYECIENTDGAQSVFVLRDDYYMDTTGYPTKITIRYYTEQTALYIDYANGTLDAAFGLTSDDMQHLMNGELENTAYKIAAKNDVYAMTLCPYTEYFQDENVRLAIAHAVDMEQVRLAAFGVLATEATSTLPAGVNYYVNVGAYEYDLELAKEYMAKSAYPNGFTLDSVVTTNDAVTVAIAEMVQFYLSQIGINMTFESYSIPIAVTEYFITGKTQMGFKNAMEGAPALDPDQIYDTIGYKSTNPSATISTDPDDEFNTNLYGGLSSVDPEVRAECYKFVQEYLHDTAYQIPIAEACVGYCYRTDYITKLNVVSPTYPPLRYTTFVDEATYNGQ